jgi:hypothetical protein
MDIEESDIKIVMYIKGSTLCARKYPAIEEQIAIETLLRHNKKIIYLERMRPIYWG